MKLIRLKQMEEYILEQGTVKMEDLCNKFEISMNTARMDVAQLVNKGTVRKVYGGVCSNEVNSLVPFEERKLKNMSMKKAIGSAAAHLVKDGDIIFIDSGTTTMYLVENLEERKDLTILTNNLNVINKVLPYAEIKVINLPGILDRKTNSFVSADTVKMLQRYNIQKAFMAATGVSNGGGITNSSQLEFEIKKMAIQQSEEAYLMMDSSKFGQATLMTYATLDQMKKVITDSYADEPFVEMCKQYNVPMELAQVMGGDNIGATEI